MFLFIRKICKKKQIIGGTLIWLLVKTYALKCYAMEIQFLFKLPDIYYIPQYGTFYSISVSVAVDLHYTCTSYFKIFSAYLCLSPHTKGVAPALENNHFEGIQFQTHNYTRWL